MATRTMTVPNVVVVGGGFGGLWAARALRRAPVVVTLVDRRNHHLFQPLLYQVATAALSPADIAAPIRSVLRRQKNVEVFMGEVVDVDRAARQLLLADGQRIAYDYLIVATGATHAYFGHPEWEPIAPGLKTVEDATEIRRRFLLAFEAAEQERDEVARRALLTFVVVGAGPTGVEMSGAMTEIARKSLTRDFRHIDPSSARIILIEGGPRVLAAYDEKLSAYAQRALERIGVQVRLNSIVTKVEEGGVWVGDEFIAARNVVWAAGVTASPLGKRMDAETDRVGRVKVQPDLSIPGDPRVFVIGDLAWLNGDDGKPLPGVAQVAMQQGRQAAKNIARDLRGEPRLPFHYRDKGSMATIGRRAAVLQMPRPHVLAKGWFAWMAWLFIHVMSLIGFRNRISVFIEWAWNYLTWQRGARLITGEVSPDLKPEGYHAHELSPSPDTQAAHDAGNRAAEDERGWMGGDVHQAAPAPKG
ncbi:MAG TPA: NAD(P)/FAD-dependent oxidoreductase [Longimicrobium sp.]|nr:NAD(P)/FAD-dependent oxidoreductase [Longimicrobium sp.]HSU13884.1 NAD(P)/FAD-dependent oxidoreductase [Longimicrobium sp.]